MQHHMQVPHADPATPPRQSTSTWVYFNRGTGSWRFGSRSAHAGDRRVIRAFATGVRGSGCVMAARMWGAPGDAGHARDVCKAARVERAW